MRRESGAIWRALLPWVLALAVPVAAAASQQTGTGSASTPDVRSAQFYVMDPADSSVLAARDEDKPAPIASITKLMTALVVLEAGQPMDEKLAITSEDVRGTVGAGSRLPKGAKLSRSDMMHLALMSSENRAAHSLCRNYPGGLAACVKAMNEKAAALGMTSARFVEPTGLSKDNVASPEDLAKLVLAAGRDETVRKYSTDPEHTVYINRSPLEFRNTNLLVKQSDWDVAVQKTGYISAAGRCLVMETVIDGRDIVIVLLNSWGSLTRIADAKRIRRWMESSLAASSS
jgi:D-alanyl-D-alanine endopeptidase (penicillin-binding protein 7)